jgi:hypothetical protein
MQHTVNARSDGICDSWYMVRSLMLSAFFAGVFMCLFMNIDYKLSSNCFCNVANIHGINVFLNFNNRVVMAFSSLSNLVLQQFEGNDCQTSCFT